MRHKMSASWSGPPDRLRRPEDKPRPGHPRVPCREAWITGSNKVNSDELTDPVMTTCGSNKVNSDELTDPVMTTCG